jgi:hypothetical protein
MDIFGGLSAVGTALSGKLCDIKPAPPKTAKIKPSQEGNLYNSDGIPRNRAQLQKMADERYAKSACPAKTGIISKYYNQESHDLRGQTGSRDCDSVFSDGGSEVSGCSEAPQSDKPLFMLGDEIRDSKKHIEKFMASEPSDSFVNQFAPLTFNTPKAPSAANKVSSASLDPTRLTMEREMCLRGGFSQCCDKMTYGVVPDDKLTHNNMVPFHKSKFGMGESIDDHQHLYDISQRKLDTFTGSLKNLDYRPKTERKPLFNPMIGLTNIYGMPVMTDAMEGRGHVSRERRNEKPFQEVKVTPGLNLGYNEVGKQGYHDLYRAFYPSIDDLRTQNKKQVSHTLPVVEGMKGQMQPLIPTVPKRHPETFQEWGTKRMLPSITENQAPMVSGYYDPSNMATVNRGMEERVTYGPEQFINTLSTPEDLIPKVKISANENFEYDGPHAIGQSQTDRAYAFDRKNAIMDPNMRTIHAQTDRAGQGMGQGQYAHGYVYDTLNAVTDPNMRTIHAQTDRAGQGMGQSQYDRAYAFDYANAVTDPNMRVIHNQFNRAGQGMGQGQYDKGYAFDSVNAVTDPNMRVIHNQYDRVGQGMGHGQYDKGYAFDYVNAVADPNMRVIHNQYDRAGTTIGQSQYDKGYAFDYANAVMDPNMRTIHDQYDRVGQGMGQSQYDQSYAFDAVNATPDPNMRTIHSQYDRAGQGMGQGQYDKGYAFDSANAVPDPNMRTIHDQYDRAGPGMGNSQYEHTYAFDAMNAVPDPTQREIFIHTDRAGVIGNGQYEHAPAFDSANAVPDPNMRTIHDKYDRAGPGMGNSQFEHTYAFDSQNAIPDPTMREVHIVNTYQGPVGDHERLRLREDAANMYQNVVNEQISIGRAPTTCNFAKGPSYNGTLVQLCNNVRINRDLFPDIEQQVTPRVGTVGTRIPLKVPNDEYHFNQHPVLNLQDNPYINNTQHVSVPIGQTQQTAWIQTQQMR